MSGRDGSAPGPAVPRRCRLHRPVAGKLNRLGVSDRHGWDQLSDAAQEAWSKSFLGRLPAAVALELRIGAREVSLRPGAPFYRGAHHKETEKLGLVMDGLLRTFRRSPDGRQLTLRYASPGKVIGLPAVLGYGEKIEAEALVASRVLVLSAVTFRTVAMREASLAWETATYVGSMVPEGQDLLMAHVFLPLRSRVARHLLDLALPDGDGLVVTATHQDVADAIGSVREVVSRAVKELMDAGYLAREPGRLILTDPAGLHAVSLALE